MYLEQKRKNENLKEHLHLTSAHCIIYLERHSELIFPIALSEDYHVIKEVAFTLGGGMLFLFMIIYVRQSRKDYQ